ncbi:uncharacterized protein LOC136086019 isoform X3 [Hydra vulgaris]
MPFIIVSSKVLDCHHGFDRNISVKKNYQVKKQKTNMDDHCFQKNYVVLQDTKKFMCPAKINMREILQFPDFKISERSVWRQNKASKMLREKLKTSSLNEIFHIRIIVVAIDDVSCHDKHLFGPAELIAQSIDPLISKKIEEYVMEGVFNVREMKRLLRIAVNDIFEKANLPPPNNRRFFPRVDTIRSHIVKIKQKLRYSLIDQECLLKKCDEWKKSNPSIKVFLRPKSETISNVSETFLFVYQSLWQQELLLRYGNEIVLLDATYRTTRYSLPLFFLVVKTNVDYQVIATFVIENETKRSITEALNIIKHWNTSFNPAFCMTDYCNEEIESLQSIFPACRVIICDFHREQAWDRWLSKIKNGCSNFKGSIISLLRCVATAQTEDQADAAIESLHSSNFWLDEKFYKFKKYITNYWLSIKEKWIWAYRRDRLLVNLNTNNGVERQNESFKYSFLQRHKNSSITGMLTVLIEEFFPDKLDHYSESNFKMNCQYRRYSSNIPEYLHNRPHHFVKHCLQKIDLANKTDLNGVILKEHGVFKVNSFSDKNKNYMVYFGDKDTMPKCTCVAWLQSAYLCKHFFLIFRKYPQSWSWQSLSSLYRESPFLNIDIKNDLILKEPLIYKCNHVNNNIAEIDITDNNTNSILSASDTVSSKPSDEITRKRAFVVSEVREMLTTIKTLTYDFDEASEEISDLHKKLSDILETLYRARKKEKGLPVRAEKTNDYIPNNLTKVVEIPSIKKKKYLTDLEKKKIYCSQCVASKLIMLFMKHQYRNLLLLMI